MSMRIWTAMGMATLSMAWACSGEVITPGSSGTAGTVTGAGGCGVYDCGEDPDAPDDDNPTCYDCACGYLVSEGGCADVCDMAYQGEGGAPNFCNAATTLPECAKCILTSCGEPDPIACE